MCSAAQRCGAAWREARRIDGQRCSSGGTEREGRAVPAEGGKETEWTGEGAET